MIAARPLKRFKLSNEHFGALLFFVLLFYALPLFIESPGRLLNFSLVIAVSLLLDTMAGIIRHKRPVCAVTGAITAALIGLLLHEAALPLQLGAAAFALIGVKHLWGGTGRNIFNPAMAALLLSSLLFPVGEAIFSPSPLYLVASLLALPFLLFRPFAGAGLALGVTAALIVRGEPLAGNSLIYSLPFFCCLVITDPVTTTYRPLTGLVISIAVAFGGLTLFNGIIPDMGALAMALLLVNALSYAADRLLPAVNLSSLFPLRLGKAIPLYRDAEAAGSYRATHKSEKALEPFMPGEVGRAEILTRLEEVELYGLGGAAFPASQKLRSLLDSESPEKFLIINGVECDPGLIHDRWLMERFSREIMLGIEALSNLTTFSKVMLAVKKRGGLDFPAELKVATLPNFYPAGAERILIERLLKRRLSPGTIPAAEGILVFNVQTVYAIYKALYCPERVMSRYITMADLIEGSSKVVEVEDGVELGSLCSKHFPKGGELYKGGGLMQAVSLNGDERVDSRTNALYRAHSPRYKESPLCSRCALCNIHCPAGLDPRRPAEKGDTSSDNCLKCGSCSYICPAGRDLAGKVYNLL